MRASFFLVGSLVCACAHTSAEQLATDVRVEGVELDLRADGRGTVTMAFDVVAPVGESLTVTRVEWQLSLSGHDFATGVVALNVLAPGGQHSRLSLPQPVAYGAAPYDGRLRTVAVGLTGELLTRSRWAEERKRFRFQSWVPVRGAPTWER